MLPLTAAKRLAGLALPLVIGGSVLAVRAASAAPTAAPAVAATCGTTTTAAGGTTTTAATTTTTGPTTTTLLPFTLPPTTLPGGTTTTAASTTTTAATTTTASTTTTQAITTTLPLTTTTACTTTTTTACPTSSTLVPTTLPATTTTSGTTTTGATTTTGGTTTSGTTTTGATTTSGTTTTGGTTTTHPATTTTTCPTTTTLRPTTTTVHQTPVVITSVSGPHIAGRSLTINGTAARNHVVFVKSGDRKNGARELGSSTSDSSGAWHLRVSSGFLYNTVLRARSGQQTSTKFHFNVHQVLRIKHDAFVGETSRGFKYKLKGSSASHITGEVITVLENGKIIGKGKMRSDGSFTVIFVVKHKGDTLTLHGTGRNGSGVEFTLPGNHRFHV